MREALGSIPSVSTLRPVLRSVCFGGRSRREAEGQPRDGRGLWV